MLIPESPQEALAKELSSLIPEATLEKFRIPASDICLYLINADYPRGKLPDEVAHRIMEQPLYWAFCWASGAVLAEYLLQNPGLVAGKRVVDFGCGSGVVAIAAAKAGAKEVIACDIDPLALLATQTNAQENAVTIILNDDWHKIQNTDVVLAADVLYDRENLPWLAAFQKKADSVIVADSRIRNFDFPGYRKTAEVDSCTLPDLDESAEFRTVSLYVAESGDRN